MPCPPPPYPGLNESDHNVVMYSVDGVPISHTNPLPVYVVNQLSGGGGVTYELYKENPVAVTPPVASGANAQALGTASLARHTGALTHSAGEFTSPGDAQTGEYVLRNTSSSSAWQDLFLDGVSDKLILPDNSTWAISLSISARDTAGTDTAVFSIQLALDRAAGPSTIRILPGMTTSVLGRDDVTWEVKAAADTYSGALRLSVKGPSGHLVRWVALAKTVEVTN